MQDVHQRSMTQDGGGRAMTMRNVRPESYSSYAERSDSQRSESRASYERPESRTYDRPESRIDAALAAAASARRIPEEWRGTPDVFGGRAQKSRGGSAESALTLRNDGPRPLTSMSQRFHDEEVVFPRAQSSLRMREDEGLRAASSLSRYSGGAAADKTLDLMRDSLRTFTNQVGKANQLKDDEKRAMVRHAGDVVALAEKMWTDMRAGTQAALQEQIDGEVEE